MPTATIIPGVLMCADCRENPVESDTAGQVGLCDSCFRAVYVQCSECRDWDHRDHYDHETQLCNRCFRDIYTQCYDCDGYFEHNGIVGHQCPECKANKFQCMERDRGPRNISWVDWADFAQLTHTVDHGCNFDCDGECSGTRNNQWRRSNGRGCCRDCSSEHGYLEHLPVGSGDEVKALYDEEMGFWRPGGCTLPVEYRSHICLTYRCGAKSRKYHADNTGLRTLDLQSSILEFQAQLTHPSLSAERAERLRKQITELSERRDKLLDVEAVKAVKAEHERQMLEAGYFSEFGEEVNPDHVAWMMQTA